MFGKFKLGKRVIFFISQIAAFTLFHNLSFPNMSEMKQKDMPLFEIWRGDLKTSFLHGISTSKMIILVQGYFWAIHRGRRQTCYEWRQMLSKHIEWSSGIEWVKYGKFLWESCQVYHPYCDIRSLYKLSLIRTIKSLTGKDLLLSMNFSALAQGQIAI